MAIPDQQLETWAHQGAVQTSSTTYQTIQNALRADSAAYAGRDYDVFLQGSYGNATNIFKESDVDVVICLNETFHSDRASLPAEDEAAWQEEYSDATYPHSQFKPHVLAALQDAFGDDVVDGNKAIRINQRGNRRKFDVLVATLYRRYYRFKGQNDQSYDEGICFFTEEGVLVPNYPKQHRANLTTRHQATSERLKPMIRVLKNIREKLVADGALAAGTAPSYFIEGLLYNVPISKFSANKGTTFVEAMNWLLEADRSKFETVNEQFYLLWNGTHTSWPHEDCTAFLDAAVKLWNDWD